VTNNDRNNVLFSGWIGLDLYDLIYPRICARLIPKRILLASLPNFGIFFSQQIVLTEAISSFHAI